MKKLLILFTILAMVGCTDDGGNKGEDNTPDYDFECTANTLHCGYYGDSLTGDLGTSNYYLTLPDATAGCVYFADIYTEEDSLEKIPNGTYAWDPNDTFADKTMAMNKSGAIINEVMHIFTTATLIVTDNTIVLTATTEDGKTHKVTFSGDYEIIDARLPRRSAPPGDTLRAN